MLGLIDLISLSIDPIDLHELLLHDVLGLLSGSPLWLAINVLQRLLRSDFVLQWLHRWLVLVDYDLVGFLLLFLMRILLKVEISLLSEQSVYVLVLYLVLSKRLEFCDVSEG